MAKKKRNVMHKKQLIVSWSLVFLLGISLVCTLLLGSSSLTQEKEALGIFQDLSTYVNPPTQGASTDDTLHNTHQLPTQELMSIVNHNPELKNLLEKSIAQAARINPDKHTNPAQTLDEYYDFIDWATFALP